MLLCLVSLSAQSPVFVDPAVVSSSRANHSWTGWYQVCCLFLPKCLSVDSQAASDQFSQDHYTYGDGAPKINGHHGHTQSQALPHTWNQQTQDQQFTQGDYTYTSVGTERSTEANDFSTDEYSSRPYIQGTNNCAVYDEEGRHMENPSYENHTNARSNFQVKLKYFVW